MNKKQIEITVVCLAILVSLAANYNSDSSSTYTKDAAAGQFAVGFLVVAMIFAGLFFVFKSKSNPPK